MVFPGRVVFPEGVVPDRFDCTTKYENNIGNCWFQHWYWLQALWCGLLMHDLVVDLAITGSMCSGWTTSSITADRQTDILYRIHSNRRSCPNRRLPPFIKLLADKNGWNFQLCYSLMMMLRSDFWVHHYISTSSFAHAQGATIRMNKV